MTDYNLCNMRSKVKKKKNLKKSSVTKPYSPMIGAANPRPAGQKWPVETF